MDDTTQVEDLGMHGFGLVIEAEYDEESEQKRMTRINLTRLFLFCFFVSAMGPFKVWRFVLMADSSLWGNILPSRLGDWSVKGDHVKLRLLAGYSTCRSRFPHIITSHV